mmetsp:Transcript_17517/g.31608  ORF Transcript_17517/g.31608 Transcript_17517/m.31608 type:complete len:729 (-) Transcript_17517:212-2398(-)
MGSFTAVLLAVLVQSSSASLFSWKDHPDESFSSGWKDSSAEGVEERIRRAKMELWSRGAFDLDDTSTEMECHDIMDDLDERNHCIASLWERKASLSPMRVGPIKNARRGHVSVGDSACLEFGCDLWTGGLSNDHHGQSLIRNMPRGGGDGGVSLSDSNYQEELEKKLTLLGDTFGKEFRDAIEQNKIEHASDCAESCELFYCAKNDNRAHVEEVLNNTNIKSYSFGSVPPEDFAGAFGFPLDIIKVTEGEPLFSSSEAADVIRKAENEDVDKNEYESGKYKLGGDWLVNLPQTREWFNKRLETTLFPLLAHLFPEIVSRPSVLRAHSVSLLKYNSSHPRTDVHIDNGILAMTLAMTPQSDYSGGGTFFEHMGVDNVLAMDVGHGTFRPGSVRHGGHPVTSGKRYILGAFLLLEDRVEHVRRLKNRGSELRRSDDLDGAEKHFEWALAINPKCTTCLKDWAEILVTRKQFAKAETKIRAALDLLENLDSDALFTLGIILSETGRDEESIQAYKESVSLNADDAELCYNLGIKFGARGDTKAEMTMYARATRIDPNFGGAWINWGTTLAENGNMEDAEVMFLKAIECCPDVAMKAHMNLALVYKTRAESLASGGNNMEGAKAAISDAAKQLESAKPLLMFEHGDDDDADSNRYAAQYKPLRIQCHRLKGQILAGMGDYESCRAEFQQAADQFPDVPGVWNMLARILDLMGKTDEAAQAHAKASALLNGTT